MQKLVDDVKKTHFDPHAAPGNWILYNLYDELPLPEKGFREPGRIKWNVNGELEQGQETHTLTNSRTVDELVRTLIAWEIVTKLTPILRLVRSRFTIPLVPSTPSTRTTQNWSTRPITHSR